MLKRLIGMLAAVALLGAAATGLAQDMPQPESTGDGVETEKKDVFDFEDDDVTGDLVKPDGEGISAETHGKTSSLIKIRSDFVPEMLESVEDL